MKKPIFASLLLFVALCTVSGCTWLSSIELDKATQVTVLPTVKSQGIVKQLRLPSGDADFAFVAPNYDCKTPYRAELHIVGKSTKRVFLDRRINLSDLVWPTTREGCVKIGYISLAREGGLRPLRFSLNRDDDDVEFKLTLLSDFEGAQDIHLWVVYSDRQPVDRMLPK